MSNQYTDFLERTIERQNKEIKELKEENERARILNEAMKKFLAGEPSNPPKTGMEKKPLM